MKRITLKYTLFTAVLLLTACKGFLDKDPIATLDAGSFFQTEADAIQAINAAYKPLTFNTGNNNFYWAFGVLAGDEAIAGGDGSRAGLIEIDALSHTPRTDEINSFWKLQFSGITQCNLVLDKVQKISFNKTTQNRVIGEALFLRSYYYFLLTQVFGDVPLFTTVVSPDKLRAPRTSKAEIYKQIIADCDRAADLLPLQYSASDLGRPTKGAALALAAKGDISF
jgi:starch-binding outer membrane protein, SusD/RagB family